MKKRWSLGSLGVTLVSIGATLVVLVVTSDTVLVAMGYAEGIPETVASAALMAASTIIGFGGACVTARTEGKNGTKPPTEEDTGADT